MGVYIVCVLRYEFRVHKCDVNAIPDVITDVILSEVLERGGWCASFSYKFIHYLNHPVNVESEHQKALSKEGEILFPENCFQKNTLEK